MTDNELHNQALKGKLSESLLENELLQEALNAIDKEVMEQWIACPARDHEGKEALWQLIKTSRKFRQILEGYIQTGKLASENLRQFEEKKRFGLFKRAA
jgi:hypothetical protein